MDASEAPIVRISDYLFDGRSCHFARRGFDRAGVLAPHGHDFAEILWAERGVGVHRIDGADERFETGAYRLITPANVHSIRASRREPLVIANLAFPATFVAEFDRLFGSDAGYRGLAALAGAPVLLDAPRREVVAEAVERLTVSRGRGLDLVRFVTVLLCEVESRIDERERRSQIPAWLGRATDALRRDPALLAEGIAAMCRAAGRSPDHLNRTTRKYLGLTASAYVNQIRLEHAAVLLRTGDRTIADIAFASGFGNLGHFYARFRERYGTPPREYRNRAQVTLR